MKIITKHLAGWTFKVPQQKARISQFAFRFVTIRSLITSVIALNLLLGFTRSSFGWDMKLKNAPNPPLAAASGYLYLLNNCSNCPNQILGFAVNETTGAITSLTNGFPVKTGGTGTSQEVFTEQLIIDPNNLRLFAINDGSDTLSAFTIDPTTGSLTSMFSPVTLGSGLWTTAVVHPSNLASLLVVGAIGSNTDPSGHLASFKITSTTATLANRVDIGIIDPLTLGFNQNGTNIYAGGGLSSKFAGFGVSSNGFLTALDNSPFESFTESPRAYAMDVQSRLFMVNRFFQQQQLRVFTTSNGIPTLVSGTNPNLAGLQEIGMGVVLPNSRFYLVSESRPASKLGVYKINGLSSTSTLTPIPRSPFSFAGDGITLLALNRTGSLLLALGKPQEVITFRVNPTTGALIRLTAQSVITPAGQGVAGMAYRSPCTVQSITTTRIAAPTVIRKIIPIGQTAPVTVKVSSSFGTPFGSVSLTVDGGTAMTATLSGGVFTFNLVMPKVGNHGLVATFTGSDCFAPSKVYGTLVVKQEVLSVQP